VDLAQAVAFDPSATRKNIEAVRPSMPVHAVSAKTGEGLDAWFGALLDARRVSVVSPT
jgi:Ni2+-binding GTPase involved in maturation of urease and hydrogenase